MLRSLVRLFFFALPTTAFYLRPNRRPRLFLSSPLYSAQSAATQEQEPSTSEVDRERLARYLGPPEPLADMQVGDQWSPFEPLVLEKVADDLPMFVLRNFVPPSERQAIVERAASKGLREGQTTKQKSNLPQDEVKHRKGSSVAWLPQDESETADVLTRVAAHLFVHPDLLDDDDDDDYTIYPENLQVVHYKRTGRFLLHHDGLNRTVTVLTYLNGVAGTWFPFVGAADDDVPTTSLRDTSVLLQGRRPGHDGLCIVGHDDDDLRGEDASTPAVVSVRPGDAVVFFNYAPSRQYGKIWNWRSLHCGLPAVQPKWIATNWFSLEEQTDRGVKGKKRS